MPHIFAHRYLRWFAALSLALIVPTANAEDSWVIQVGAYSKAPGAAELSALEEHGSVVSTTNPSGLSIISIGPYNDRSEAQAALASVQAVAPDAYIRRAPRDEVKAVANAAPVAVANAGSDAAALLNRLPADERRNVVMLDGRLHYKEGERFTPLAEYLSSR